MNVFLLSYSQSDLFGKAIFFALFFLSVVCWIVLLEKMIFIRRIYRQSRSFQRVVEQNRDSLLESDLSQDGDPDFYPYGSIYKNLREKVVEILDKNRFFLLEESGTPAYLTPTDVSLLEGHVATLVTSHQKRLEKNLFILSTIATLAPFMGLLGTVWGILTTFSGLQQGGAISSNTLVLGGISTALVTTVLGLLIAIPALIAYNYLKNSLHHYSCDMESFLNYLLYHVELRYRKPELVFKG